MARKAEMKLERPWEVDRSKVGGWKVWRREEWWVGWKLSWAGVGVGGGAEEKYAERIYYMSRLLAEKPAKLMPT